MTEQLPQTSAIPLSSRTVDAYAQKNKRQGLLGFLDNDGRYVRHWLHPHRWLWSFTPASRREYFPMIAFVAASFTIIYNTMVLLVDRLSIPVDDMLQIGMVFLYIMFGWSSILLFIRRMRDLQLNKMVLYLIFFMTPAYLVVPFMAGKSYTDDKESRWRWRFLIEIGLYLLFAALFHMTVHHWWHLVDISTTNR